MFSFSYNINSFTNVLLLLIFYIIFFNNFIIYLKIERKSRRIKIYFTIHFIYNKILKSINKYKLKFVY